MDDQRRLAEELLMDWHYHTTAWRPNLGYPAESPDFKNSKSSRQWDDPGELIDDARKSEELKAVQYCYDEIAFPFQNAIGCELKNRHAGVTGVWRSKMGKTFDDAMQQIMPVMIRRGLL